MGAQTKITITHDVADVAVDLQSKGITAQNGKIQHANWLQNLLNRLCGGVSNGTLVTTIDKGDGVAASGTLTFNNAGVAGDTLTVNGVVFTAVASGATGNQYDVGATAAITAANAQAALAASASALVAASYLSSSVAGAVVTITSAFIGLSGNQATLSAAQASITASGARLAGGAAATGSVSTALYAFGE